MVGISRDVIEHALSVNPAKRPIKQRCRQYRDEKNDAMKEEVQKLLAAGFIREVLYPEWLANPVLVKKPNGTWRMCIDFTDLNNACPKDSYPLPNIDTLVDATSGHDMLSFMDAFSGYHQIRMKESDEEKTAFITQDGTYCYKMMPFGLKNAGATYQRLVNKIFAPVLGKTVEAYVDDMLVKSATENEHVAALESAFAILRKYSMRLNPKKCTFGVTSGKFLGFIVTRRGIEANPDKIQAIVDMAPPRNVKEIQKLTGRLAALSRFLSRSAEKSLPFFKVLRGQKQFEWTPECQKAFDDLKTHLASPPLLTKPVPEETLFIYLAVSDFAVSSVLVREDDKIRNPSTTPSKISA
ncbi:hypothetical protein Dimus_039803 [Dionaea muscipula]